jgi:hypothetical protein
MIGRGSNLIGAALCAATAPAAGRGASATGAGFGLGAFVTATFAGDGLELALGDFTGTFVVAICKGLAGGLSAFFLGAATFGVVFLDVAFTGRFAAFLGFFEGI